MDLGFFNALPSELAIDILSRLPIRSIKNCKCVCKSWLELVNTREFVKFHLYKSVPKIATILVSSKSKSFGIIEFTDMEHHNLHPEAITILPYPNFRLCSYHFILGSVDGLLLLNKSEDERGSILLCNPITREYIDIYSQELFSYRKVLGYGFGKSKITEKYKVVILICTSLKDLEYECNVYTLGTGSWRTAFVTGWRSIASHGLFECTSTNKGAFVNGNLHWFAYDSKGSPEIACLDLETELSTTFSLPPLQTSKSTKCLAMENCLCLCLYTSNEDIIMWSMNEYGVDTSWTKKFVITGSLDIDVKMLVPFKVLKDGDILFSYGSFFQKFCYYSIKNKSIQIINDTSKLGVKYYCSSALHTSSFLSLKSFAMERSVSY